MAKGDRVLGGAGVGMPGGVGIEMLGTGVGVPGTTKGALEGCRVVGKNVTGGAVSGPWLTGSSVEEGVGVMIGTVVGLGVAPGAKTGDGVGDTRQGAPAPPSPQITPDASISLVQQTSSGLDPQPGPPHTSQLTEQQISPLCIPGVPSEQSEISACTYEHQRKGYKYTDKKRKGGLWSRTDGESRGVDYRTLCAPFQDDCDMMANEPILSPKHILTRRCECWRKRRDYCWG